MSKTEELLQESLRQNNELMKEIKQLNEQVAYLTNKLYGRHSEKMENPDQLSLLDNSFTDPEQTGNQSEEISESQTATPAKKHRRTRSEIISGNLPVEEVIIKRKDDHCEHGHQLVPVGKHFVRKVIHRIPGKLFVEIIYEETYKCVDCEKLDGCSQLYHGKAPQALIAHSVATPSLIAEILNQKYVLGTPIYRQLKEWQRAGVLLSETTISNWIIKCAAIVKPLYDLLHQRLIEQRFLQGDETPYEVLREPNKPASSKSYIWVIRSISRSDKPIVYYVYGDTRSGKFAQKIYQNFTGVLQCDGYAGYNLLTDSITRVGCWAHVRRKFYDDANKVRGHFKETRPLAILNEMFHLEKQWSKSSSSERLDRRSKSLKPLIDNFWQWCDQAEALPKSRLGKALIYAQNQRKALNQILNFGEIDLSNNASERNMKSYVIGRKNWLFSTSPKGAEANAIWMSLIESAKANGLTPFKYLQDIIEKISKLPVFSGC
ncbi:IS66 family transposase [Liquorilactobacillus nagelii]|uniref:IS66 family transposase n=1 Tax=Liquorilactobacillus nagelii TaxID=82688 RepID=UPI001CCA3E8D|nr:IS66 family transposase [Liquorilactobacillus nagelii]ULQ48788.1 IS66 family transposase [Liquorilactobacillus nagelii]